MTPKRMFQVKTWRTLLRVIIDEYRAILSDSGALLILLFAPIIYSTIYSIAYAPEVVHDIPIGIIDNSRTAESRHLISSLDSGANLHVAFEPCDMQEAERLLFSRDIYGVVFIPHDYADNIATGRQTTVSLYADASYFLVYRQIVEQSIETINRIGADIEYCSLRGLTQNSDSTMVSVEPLSNRMHNLYNPYLGYGTFVMPAVIMVIIQQTLLLGVGMISGTQQEHRRNATRGRVDAQKSRSVAVDVFAKIVVYGSIYALSSLYILVVHYRLFSYPMNGTTADVAIFTALYITACILFAIAVSSLFRHRESALLLLLWSSIPVLMLSGASFPREAIPNWLYSLGSILPSSSGVEGFIRIQTMGASLEDVMAEIERLLILSLLYFTLSLVGLRRRNY